MDTRNVRIITGHSPDGLSVTVQDDASGTTILDFELTAEQAFRFVTGHGFDAMPAKVVTAKGAAQLGKHHSAFVRLFKITDDAIRQAIRNGQPLPQALQTWTDALRCTMWARTASWDLRNNGLALTVRRYDDEPLSPEMRQKIQATMDLAVPPAGLEAHKPRGAWDR